MKSREFIFGLVLTVASIAIVWSWDWSGWLMEKRRKAIILSCENPDFVNYEFYKINDQVVHTEYTYRCDDGKFLHTPTMLTTRSEERP